MLCTGLGPPQPAAAQARPRPTFTISDAVVFGAAGALYLAPDLFAIDNRSVDCLPCDPATLPWYDRWVVAVPRRGWSRTSDVLVIGLAAATWFDLSRDRPDRNRRVVASMESVALATGAMNLLKELVGRPRPVFYTDAAPEYDPADVSPSFPSGHTAVAFALATSYALRRSTSPAARVAAFAGAAAVGSLRLAAGRHFPSDVAAGMVVGVSSALLVHTIKF